MKKLLFALSILFCLTAMAQEKIVVQQNVQHSEHQASMLGKGLCQELRIKQKNGKSIYGILCKPATKGKHGVAIISHGFNGTHHFGKDYFKVLNDLGYAVYSFDFPCGSIHSQSDNNTMNMSVLDEKEALKSIVAYFQKQKDIDKSHIVLCGESQGGLVSALTAAELKKQISQLVLIYPALCIPDNWNDRYPDAAAIPDTTKVWNVPLGKRFFTECRNIDVYNTIGNYEGPVLIVHGSEDAVVPLSYSERAVKTYKNASMKVIDKAKHGFNPFERGLSNQYVKEFITPKR